MVTETDEAELVRKMEKAEVENAEIEGMSDMTFHAQRLFKN